MKFVNHISFFYVHILVSNDNDDSNYTADDDSDNDKTYEPVISAMLSKDIMIQF